MTLNPILINGEWREACVPSGKFQAFDPTKGSPLPEIYPISSWNDIEAALQAGSRAAREMARTSAETVTDFLDLFAAGILERADDLVSTAHQETGLPKVPRLELSELPRTTNQLHQAAAAGRDRSWCRATIDTKLNIRSMYGPLGGPVAVFGPNNFPFAFNAAAGGDFAAALAAGNPVIAKAHPGHPGTTKLFAVIALEALKKSSLPLSAVQMIYHMRPEVGLKLVGHPFIGATAFTGSRSTGLQLKSAADRAGKPIYLEMSSVNPVFLLPGSLRERGDEIAVDLFSSCSLGAGQFCTKPGLVVLMDEEAGRKFLETTRRLFDQPPVGVLVSQSILEAIKKGINELAAHGAEILTGGNEVDGSGFRFMNTLLFTEGSIFLRNPAALQLEVFGMVTLLVLAKDLEEMLRIATVLEGNLTTTIYSETNGMDDSLYAALEPVLRPKTGRLLNDKMPTGVAVVPAMVHGGPFPAAGHPGFTSVGIPASMIRFAALRGYDNVRQARLPAELRNANPTGRMWRMTDGEWTQKSI